MGMPNLKKLYLEHVVPELKKELGIDNVMGLPRIDYIVVNMGIGNVDGDVFKKHIEELAAITGQKPLVTKARKSISNFKLRKGTPIGAKVTLRSDRMYEFLERLISAALPRIRDFRGLPLTSFDGRGNYSFGIKEQTIFPEIQPDKVSEIQGMDVTIVTKNADDKKAYLLLKLLGFPFEKRKKAFPKISAREKNSKEEKQN
jgi:large subunit ribosomal protein L5